jgi:hypothetical protein
MSLLQKLSRTGVDSRPGSRLKRHLPRLALIGILLLLGACSGTTFLYNRLNIILPWYLGSYVDLDREQKNYLDDLLQPFLVWHREEELPRYLAVIDRVTATLDRDVSADDVATISLKFEAAWFRLETRGLDWMLALGERLTEEQMAEFVDVLWKKQREYEEEYLNRSDEEFRRDSYDGLTDSLQDYLGRLDSDQHDVLRQASEDLRRSDRVWLAERAAWIERFELLLQREPGWQQRVRESIARRDDTVSEDYLDTYTHNLEVIHTAIAAVLNSRSEKQDRRLRRELDKLREDFQTLIEQGAKRSQAEAA